MEGDNTSTIIASRGTQLVPEWTRRDERPAGSRHIICGRRQTGKTTLLNDLLRVKACYNETLVFDPSPVERERLPAFISAEYIHESYDDSKVRELMEHAAEALKNGKNERRLLIVGGCTAQLCKEGSLFELCCSSYRWNIDVYLVVDHLSGVLPSIRSNADYVFLMPTNSRDERQRYHRVFFGNIGCLYKTLDGAFDANARDYGAVVYDARTSSIAAYHARTDLTRTPWPTVEIHDSFNADSRLPGALHIIAGGRASGKKMLLMSLLDVKEDDISAVVALWSDRDALEGYGVAPSRITDGYDDEQTRAILDDAIDAKRNGRNERRSVVFVDCFHGDANEMKKHAALLELCCTSHHCGVDVYIVVQDLRSVSPRIRSNADYVFLLRGHHREALRLAHRDYFDRDGSTFERFVEMVEVRTRDHGVVVFDRSASRTLRF
ncbi:VV A32-like virion packaging ATPase [Acanthamoeba castellanii medusavirus]|uniref:VV A32-like virion packaging ATPase n=1 Tax=Acanthamoeba castellanii medusavirus J1 TaxID=3114988 RepID=A0A3T1CWH1_9VIRU|nr:VV A32-like virion packaging ATPase [Acanthamoeba castellanii medusavirus]BBI30177.1 VV A32-like virion packaging ATPase [Acanthamoeba castellanii medusavirus J1]